MEKILEYQNISDRLIINNFDKLNMTLIPRHQEISENTSKEIKDVIYWNEVFKHQELSEYFINDNSERIDRRNSELYEKFIKNHFERTIIIYHNFENILVHMCSFK